MQLKNLHMHVKIISNQHQFKRDKRNKLKIKVNLKLSVNILAMLYPSTLISKHTLK